MIDDGRRTQLLDGLRNRRRYWELKEETEDLKMWKHLQEREEDLGVDGRTILEWILIKWVSMQGIIKYINKKERERHLPGYCQ